MTIRVEILPDAEAVAERGAEHISEAAERAIAERGSFTLAVSGGKTPTPMFERLVDLLPWERVTIYQVDERVAPDGHTDRNLTLLRESLGEAEIDIRAMPVDMEDLAVAAADYSSSLPERLDLVHLGIGADGHTASLVPGDPVLDVRDRDVAATDEYMCRRRLTLTYPALDRARELLWVVTGKDKADALRRLLDGDRSIPAGRVSNVNALVLADASAGSAAPAR